MSHRFLLEIGTEELPATDVWSAIEQIKQKVPYLLASQEIKAEGKIAVYGTARRLVVYIKNIARIDKTEPSRFRNFTISLIKSLKFEKSMRWLPESAIVFSRPIRWLVLILNNKSFQVEYAGVKSSTISYGPRFLSSPKFQVKSVNDYFKQIEKHCIILDQEKRRKIILKQNKKLSSQVDGVALKDKDLLDEVVQLVEYPTCIRCRFDKRFLRIPKEVTITVMKKHQRYFPILNTRGDLLPYFITVANQLKKNANLIRKGNENVVEARLSDGEFFYQQDRKQPLSHFVPQLKEIVFHEQLGNVYEKGERLEKIAVCLAEMFDLNKRQSEELKIAAHLCKADLATSLVIEFPSLQGVIGRIYAQKDGQSKTVAQAIYEHYLPKVAGDQLPQSKTGLLLAIADRIDTLTAFFAVGIRPKGSQDPYALRRTALGLVHLLREIKKEIKLTDLVDVGQKFLPLRLSDNSLAELVKFIKERIKADLKEAGFSDDVIKAVLAGNQADHIYSVYKIVPLVSREKKEHWFKNFVLATKRTQNIIRSQPTKPTAVDKKLFEEDAEIKLFAAYLRCQKRINRLIVSQKFAEILACYRQLIDPINIFFDKVLVMTKNKRVSANRLKLLVEINDLINLLFKPTLIVF